MTNDAPGFLGMIKCRLAVGILCRLDSVFFICRKAWETKEGDCNIVRSFMRQEIAMMRAAEFVTCGIHILTYLSN